MQKLTPSDASLLAVIAENPGMPQVAFGGILARISDESKPIAEAIRRLQRSGSLDEGTDRAVGETAKALIKWAQVNRRRAPRKSSRVVSQVA